jgi:hypothetical protein
MASKFLIDQAIADANPYGIVNTNASQMMSPFYDTGEWGPEPKSNLLDPSGNAFEFEFQEENPFIAQPFIAQYGNPELYQGFVERGDPLPYEPSQNWFQKMWSGAQNKLGEGWNFAKEVPGMAISAAMGVPFIGQGIMAGVNAFQDMLGPNYRAMVEKDLKGQGFTVDGLGRIVKTGDYATPENIMAGYSLAHPNITGSAFDRYDDIRERIKRGKFKNVERAKKKLDALGQFALQKEAARKAAYDKAIQDAKNAKKAERARIKSISAGYGGHDDRPGATGPTAAGAGMGVGGGYASDYGYLKDGGRVGYANGGLASLFTRRG